MRVRASAANAVSRPLLQPLCSPRQDGRHDSIFKIRTEHQRKCERTSVDCKDAVSIYTDGQQEDSSRASRLRDNKRRHRQRQKDYTASLESKVRELQSQGIQATQEVQSSARKVVEENARLRALLRHVGVEDHVVNNWTPDASMQIVPVAYSQPERRPCRNSTCDRTKATQIDPSAVSLAVPVSTSAPLPNQKIEPHHQEQEARCSKDIQKAEASSAIQLPPCKVLTQLAQNPSADVTQPSLGGQNPADDETGGVECSKAHKMLMQYATSEEKIDIISQALESGCTKKAGGGCKVRNEAIWKAIDEVT